MGDKTWILCQGGLWTERRTFSPLNVSFQDLGDSRKSLKWIISFTIGGNLGIVNLIIANRNHYCTQIHLFTTRTMVFQPTKPILMKIFLFLLSTEASSYAEISRKTVKSRIQRNGCVKKLLKKRWTNFQCPERLQISENRCLVRCTFPLPKTTCLLFERFRALIF